MARRRRRGEGSVFYSHAEGCWIARVSLGTRDGRRIRHKARAGSEREARAELETLLRAYGAGGNPATMTLDGYLDEWLKSHGPSVRPSTLTSYECHVRRHISPLLGGIIVAKLRPADVRRLVADRIAAGLKPATVGLVATTLRIALSQAVAERSIPDNPATAIRLPKVEREPVRAMTMSEAEDLLDAISGDPFEAVYRLLLGSGLRLGEALSLDQGDVHLDSAFVSVRRSKSKVRATPISADAVAALRTHLASSPRRGPNEPVFLGPRSGERLGGYTVSHAFPRMLERVGLPKMRVHDLRHATATLMLAASVPMRVISEQLGHSNPSLTARVYAHVVPEAQRLAVGVLPTKGSHIGSRSA